MPEKTDRASRSWIASAAGNIVGAAVMAVGLVLILVGVVALIADGDPSPTAAAILSGATLVAVGALLANDAGANPALAGAVWRALAGDTAARAEVMATDLPEHLRPLLVDLAKGTAAARYIEIERTLRTQLEAGATAPAGGDPVAVVAGAVRELSRASVQEAWTAVAPLAEPPPAEAAVPRDPTDVMSAVPPRE